MSSLKRGVILCACLLTSGASLLGAQAGTITGKVTEKSERDGIGYVKCEIGLRNDRGQTSHGWAEIALPTRGQMLPLVWQ